MSNTYYEKKNAINAELNAAKVEVKSDLVALDNKPFYSRRQVRRLVKDSWMKFAFGISVGLLIALIAHFA